ncbi:MAG: FkbM family methyltransferase [Chlorobi bacterium]|nr:FkbM family methyltransferase [Chlorobiota bacterium]MCI0714850.1 FkbM family methyltransferase [Chlorobiota bacterium]
MKNGLKLSVNRNSGDLTTLFEIFVNSDYNFKGDPKISFNILDIGANVGYFSLYIAKRFPKSSIFCFEPFTETYGRLTDNLMRNNSANIKAYRLAVSDFNGTSQFYSLDWAGCNTLIKGKFDEGHYKTTNVECISFDDIFKLTGVNEFMFGKIDCEGSEYQIFLNSRDESIRSVRNYIIEVHNDKKFTSQDLITRFQSLGYIVKYKKNLMEANLIQG